MSSNIFLKTTIDKGNWKVPDAFLENLITRVDKLLPSDISDILREQVDFVIKFDNSVISLENATNKDIEIFYEAVVKVFKDAQQTGVSSYDGNPEFHEQYLEAIEELMQMLREDIKDRDPEYYDKNISN